MNKIFDIDYLHDVISIQGGCYNHGIRLHDGDQNWKDYAFEAEDSAENLGFRLIRRI